MKPDKRLELIALASSFTFFLAGSIALGYFIGNYLDESLGGRGLFAIIFILLGIFSGFYSLYRVLNNKKRK
ncbi:MAG: AtpZ/AtpI family protein [Firmicutes bacterium]|nr:AtpZ/AtpI family protein [Bacillota bacterium]